LSGIYFGVAAVFSYLLHKTYETTVIPDQQQVIFLLFSGIAITGASYNMWAYGIKNGNLKTLTLLSFSNPIVSIGLLIFFGKTTPSPSLAAACFLVTAGCMSSHLVTIAKKKLLFSSLQSK
jgi:drug/metabolite transporter (DMT)-like permease